MEKTERKEISHIGQEIIVLLKLPCKPFNFPFFAYLFGIIILFGGAGIWVAIYDSYLSPIEDGYLVAYNMATFFMAIWATAYIDLDLLENIQNKLSLKIIMTVLFLIIVILFFWTFRLKSNSAFIPATIGFCISITIWFLGNASNEKFNEKTYNDKIRSETKEKHGQKWK